MTDKKLTDKDVWLSVTTDIDCVLKEMVGE